VSRRLPVRLRLYVASGAPNSAQALGNIRALCATHLPGGFEIELVDVFREPKRALADEVFMTPTLMRIAPAPMVRIVGTLNSARPVLDALGLVTIAA
jgi:circadian clock protein KaiB